MGNNRGSGRLGEDLGTDRTVFEPLEPGSYCVRLEVSQKDTSTITNTTGPILQQRIEIQSGLNEITLTVPALHELPIRFPIGDRRVSRIQVSTVQVALDHRGMSGYAKPGLEERVVIRNVSAGRYRLSGGGLELMVSVPGGEVLYQEQ